MLRRKVEPNGPRDDRGEPSGALLRNFYVLNYRIRVWVVYDRTRLKIDSEGAVHRVFTRTETAAQQHRCPFVAQPANETLQVLLMQDTVSVINQFHGVKLALNLHLDYSFSPNA